MNQYSPPTDTSALASSGRSLNPEVLRELHKVRKSMQHMEKMLQVLCIVLLKEERLCQQNSSYDTLFSFDPKYQRRRRQKHTVSYWDIL